MIDPNDITFSNPTTNENGTTRIKAVLTIEATYDYTIDPDSNLDYESVVKDLLTDAIMGHVYPE